MSLVFINNLVHLKHTYEQFIIVVTEKFNRFFFKVIIIYDKWVFNIQSYQSWVITCTLLLHKYAESGGMIWEENDHLWSSWFVGLGSPHTVSSLDQITLKDVDIPYLPQVSGRG